MSESARSANGDLIDGRPVEATRAGWWTEPVTRSVCVAIVVLAVALRSLGLGREPWLDEAATLHIVGSDTWHDRIMSALGTNMPPGYTALLTLWAWFSDDLAWLRVLSLVAGIGALVVAMWWTATATRSAAWLTGMLVAASPVLLRYSVELRPYGLLLLATAWAGLVAAQLTGSREPSRPWLELSLGLSLTLAVATHFAGVLLVVAIAAMLVTATLLDPPRLRWRVALGRLPWRPLATVVVAAVGLVVIQRATLSNLAGDWWMPPLSPTLAVSTVAEVFGLAAPGGARAAPLAVGAVFLGLAGLFFAARGSARLWLPPLMAATVYCLAIAVVSITWLPIWWPRVLTPGLIPLAVAVSLAVTHLPHRSWRLIVAVMVVGASTVTAQRWVARDARAPIEAWPAATADLMSLDLAAPILCLPRYVTWPLDYGLGLDSARLVPVNAGSTAVALRDQLSPALAAAARGDPVGLAVRVDLTFRQDPELLNRVIDELMAVGQSFTLHVAMVTSSDVSLVPSLADEARAAELRLRARLGEPAGRVDGDRWLRLTFDVGG